MVVDQQLADKINGMNEIIEDLNNRLKDIEASHTKSNTMADESKEETFIQNDDNIVRPEAQLVGQDNEIQSKALELDELTIENMIEIEFINGHRYEDLVFSNRDLNVSEVVVNELILKNHKNYLEIIGKSYKDHDHEEMIQSASESFVAPMTGDVDKMKVNSLIVDGSINQLDISILNEFALKIRGDQILEGGIYFKNLRAASLQASGAISEKNINDIARTVNGPFTVDQALRFAKPVFINELIVNQRINNINVVKGAFNILLKRSDHDQVIQAMKIFDEVTLLNPIVLQGKITKSNLNKINPIVSFTDEIVLEGNVNSHPSINKSQLIAFISYRRLRNKWKHNNHSNHTW